MFRSAAERRLTAVLPQEAASWAVHRLLLHGAGLRTPGHTQEQR